MWGCNAFGPHWGGFIFPVLFYSVLILALVLLAMKLFQSIRVDKKGTDDRRDSLEILKARFARGEISSEEFVRMKEILEK